MPWYSILPADLIYLESWAAKVFFALGLLTIIPWAVLLAFDLVLYISRMSLYEMPVLGGRARGREGGGSPVLRASRGGAGGDTRLGAGGVVLVGGSETERDKYASASAVSLVAGQVDTPGRDTDGEQRR